MSQEDNNKSFAIWLREPQTMIGLSAIVLSICGLFISFYEASLIREHQRASVWPNIELGYSFGSDQIGFHIQNTGIGPARIKAANLSYEGKTVKNWTELVRGTGILNNIETELEGLSPSQSFITNKVLPQNSDGEYIFKINVTEKNEANRAFFERFAEEIRNQNIDIYACYCSVYEECWVAYLHDFSNESGDNRKVENCTDIENSDI